MDFSRRHLPHLHVIGEPLFVTFRLHGSLPAGREFRGESMTSGRAFVCMDRLLDNSRTGPMYLRLPDVANLVADSIHQGANNAYLLHTWVVMPNHVHLLITPQCPVPEIMRHLKGSTAREANRLLGRTGTPFWQQESYDRLVRNPEEFRRIEKYIIQNPVKAGLAASIEEYRWSSAYQAG
jgi:REP element-mobilizing transposase RayT